MAGEVRSASNGDGPFSIFFLQIWHNYWSFGTIGCQLQQYCIWGWIVYCFTMVESIKFVPWHDEPYKRHLSSILVALSKFVTCRTKYHLPQIYWPVSPCMVSVCQSLFQGQNVQVVTQGMGPRTFGFVVELHNLSATNINHKWNIVTVLRDS